MIDDERTEQEAYERGYDIEELALQTQSGKRTLRELEEERDHLEDVNMKLHSRKQFWMVAAILITAVLVVVCGVFWYMMKKNKPGSGAEPTPSTSVASKSYRICTDTEAKIREFNAKNGNYTASLETVMDKEYVAFSYGSASNPEYRLLYRNEYVSAEDAERGEYGSWMATAQIIDYEVPYTLADDWSKLTPEPVIMGGTKYVLFVQEKDGQPSSIVVLEPGLMNVGKEQGCFDAVKNWFKLEPGEEAWAHIASEMASDQTGDQDGDIDIPQGTDLRKTIMITTGHGNRYAFSASDEVLALVREKGSGAFSFGERFQWEIADDGIHISSPLYVREGEYYGEVTATVLPVQGSLKVSNASVGAYVSFNYDDKDFNGVNTPAVNYIENPVSLSNGTDEKLYLPEYKRVAKHSYNFDKDHYWQDEKGYRYVKDDNGTIISRMGIDVSKHKGDIDWKKVADSGIEFAIIRVGFRGPGEGTLEPDECAKANIEGALKNNLDVGVYFYSQAITEAEAIAEADYVLNFIKDYDINWPIVFDTELYEDRPNARGNATSREQRTACAKAFLDHVRAAGYQAMLYSSTRWSILSVNRDELADYPFWYALYSDKNSYRYDFCIWQYTSSGTVPGVKGNCDLDLWLAPWPSTEKTATGEANSKPNGSGEPGGNSADDNGTNNNGADNGANNGNN